MASIEVPRVPVEERAFSISSLVENIRIEALNQQRQKAQTFLNRSGFLALSERMADEIGGEITKNAIHEDINHNHPIFISRESVFIAVSWNQDWEEGKSYSASSFFIEALPTGNIIVHGDMVGTTILYKSEWHGNTASKEKALKKAFAHPFIVNWEAD